ncbi:glycosyl transferase family protein [Aquirhabdus sp.]|uniref:glycosyl transferase family protein n=1 Tax=Aquirhabdus sp. TaxID=2824160 RepID=UPI00396CBC22
MNTPRPRPQPNQYKDVEHPFAQYVRILGKGKRGSRSLTFEEATDAFGQILDDQVLDVQLGAFLMLLRVKEESVDELAGFVTATRERLNLPALSVDLDWSSYAGKRKHYPWFLLAALTLAQSGIRVFMHGAAGHTINRLYTENVLPVLGFPVCQSADEVQAALDQYHFAYLPLSVFSPKLGELIELRNVMGLRSPVHTLARLINPFNAPVTLQSIFHPAYRVSHQQTALRLGYANAAVIKGEGGEFERNPDARTLVLGIKDAISYETEWDMLNEARSDVEESFDLDHFIAVWKGKEQHAYGEKAVVGTLALALVALQKAQTMEDAMHLAQSMWDSRPKI